MRLLVVSNMYPSSDNPAFGVFVKRVSDQMSLSGIHVDAIVRTDGGKKLWSYLLFYWRVFWAVLRSDADDVYAHFATHSFPPIWLAFFFRKLPLIIHVHGADIVPEETTSAWKKVLLRIVAKKALSRAFLVVAPSEYFRTVVARDLGISPEKIIVSPSGGVDMERFAFVEPSLEKRRLLFLGRLIKGKGVLDIIPALEYLKSHWGGDDFDLVVAGDGPLRGALEEQAANSSLHVSFLGAVAPDAVPGVIGSCHAVVFPSYRKGESLGLVAVEALACGRPVIAAMNGVMDELIVAENGFKFKAGNMVSMAEAVHAFLACDDQKLLELCHSARASAQAYSSDHVAKDLYEKLRRHCDQ